MSNLIASYNHFVSSLSVLDSTSRTGMEQIADRARTQTLSLTIHQAAESLKKSVEETKVTIATRGVTSALTADIELLYHRVVTLHELTKKREGLHCENPADEMALKGLERGIIDDIEIVKKLAEQQQNGPSPLLHNFKNQAEYAMVKQLLSEKDLENSLLYVEQHREQLTRELTKKESVTEGLYLTPQETGLQQAIELSRFYYVNEPSDIKNLLLTIHPKRKLMGHGPTNGTEVSETFKIAGLSVAISLASNKLYLVNQLIAKNEESFDEIQDELQLLRQVNGKEGIIPIISYVIHQEGDKVGEQQVTLIVPQYEMDLKTYVESKQPDQEKCLMLAKQTIKGLQACHDAEIVHGDINLKNYRILKEGEVCDLTNFSSSFNPLEHVWTSGGTYANLAPESLLAVMSIQKYLEHKTGENRTMMNDARSDVSLPSDIFSWGIEMWRTSHQGKNPDWYQPASGSTTAELTKKWKRAEKKIKDPFDQILHQALHPNPLQRARADAIADALDNLKK